MTPEQMKELKEHIDKRCNLVTSSVLINMLIMFFFLLWNILRIKP